MITDFETNFLYLSDRLEHNYNDFFNLLVPLLRDMDIKYDFLLSTKDIWARDYMPIQVSEKQFVQFKYVPDYLYEKNLQHTITDPKPILSNIKIDPDFRYDIKLDGGNVVKWKNKAIITETIYAENPEINKDKLGIKIKDCLGLDDLIIIPPEPDDYSGHADGMVRFLDEKNILVNDYYGFDVEFRKKLKNVFRKHKLHPVTFPYYPQDIKNELDDYTALGCYINFMHIGNKIILPEFGISQDRKAIQKAKKILNEYWKGIVIETVNCHKIAWEGGVLNCVGWGVKKK